MVWRCWKELVLERAGRHADRLAGHGRPQLRPRWLLSRAKAKLLINYDHKRHRKLKDEGRSLLDVRLPIWDFVIERADGTGVRLHPQRSTVKVETFDIERPINTVGTRPRPYTSNSLSASFLSSSPSSFSSSSCCSSCCRTFSCSPSSGSLSSWQQSVG